MNLITGATGFLGAHIAYDLVKAGEKVRCLARPSSDLNFIKTLFDWYSGEGNSLFQKIEWVEGDVTDLFSLQEAANGIGHLYHCAGIVSFSRRHRRRMIETNIRGTANVVNTALDSGIRKMCHISSIAALGDMDGDRPIDERIEWSGSEGHSSYALTKFAGEREVWRGIEEGLNAVIVNPSIILGPCSGNKGNSVMQNLICHGLKYYTSGENGFVDVRDVAKASLALMRSDISGERFIISSENISYSELLRLAASLSGNSAPEIKISPIMLSILWRLDLIRSLVQGRSPSLTRETAANLLDVSRYDNRKIREAVNIEFRSVAETLKHVCAFNAHYKDNGGIKMHNQKS